MGKSVDEYTMKTNEYRAKNMEDIAKSYDYVAVKWLHLQWELDEFIENF